MAKDNGIVKEDKNGRVGLGNWMELAAWLGGGLIIYLTYWLSNLGYYRSGDDVGYWMGWTGGIMMLLLFTYPLRKYIRAFHKWGKVRSWFLVHMLLGLFGPLVTLAHAQFSLKSLNAQIAIMSMLVVVFSGVIGRFVYLQIYRGLGGEKDSLESLDSFFSESAERAKGSELATYAPNSVERLRVFGEKARSVAVHQGWKEHLKGLILMPIEGQKVLWQCKHDLRVELKKVTRAKRKEEAARLYKLADDYVFASCRVASFSAYAKLFSLWHVLHVPVVVMLVVCVVVHVIAVHMY